MLRASNAALEPSSRDSVGFRETPEKSGARSFSITCTDWVDANKPDFHSASLAAIWS